MTSGFKTSGFNSVSSGFGPRVAPVAGASTFHAGVDFRMPVGTGVETSIGLTYVGGGFQANGAGYFEKFRDDNGNTYSFLHLNEPSGFTVGERLAPGDVPVISGNTGIGTGAHLDFRMTDASGNRVNPTTINPATGLPYTASFGPENSNEGLGGTTRYNLAATQAARGEPVTAPTTGEPPASPAPESGAPTVTDPNQLTDAQKGIQTDIDRLTSEFDSNNQQIAKLDEERESLLENGFVNDPRIAEIDAAKAGYQEANANIEGQITDKTADFNQAGGAGSGAGGTGTGGAAGAAGAAKAAAGAGGAGGGAGCLGGAMISGIAGIAMGGLLGGLGLNINGALSNLTGALGSLPGVGPIANAMQGAASVLGGGAFSALSNMGAGIIPGLGNVIPSVLQGAMGQLMSPITSVLANPLNLPNVVQQMTNAGGLKGFVQQVGGNMVGNFVNGTVQNALSNIGIAGAMSGINRNVVGAVGEAMNQNFGSVLGGVGAVARNMEGIVTYGISTLGNNLGAVAANMIATGDWDTANLTRLMQPGNIASQIISRGLGEVTGLNAALINNGIPLAAVDNPIYDVAIQRILSQTNSRSAIDAVRDTFSVAVDIANLGDLSVFTTMMPNVANQMPVNNFADLGKTLIDLQLTQAKTFSEIGSTFLKLESSRDLNHLVQLPTPMYKPAGDLLMKGFGYGGGTFGELTPGDMLGSAAGYVHNDTMPVIIDNINFLRTQPICDRYFALAEILELLMRNTYYFTETVTDPETGETTTNSGHDVPTVGRFDTLDSAVLEMVRLIEAQLRLIKNNGNGDVQSAIEKIDLAHTASVSQVVREGYLWDLYGISILDPQPMTPLNAYVGVQSISSWAEQTGYGQVADVVERLATDDLYGDAIKATMRQVRNAKLLDELGVNIERFSLPNAQYYRNPLGLYRDLYNANIPTVPLVLRNTEFSYDPVEQYIIERDSALIDEGYTDVLLPAEKDQLYADVYWKDVDDSVRRRLGEGAVRAALLKNMRIFGDNLDLIDLDRRRVRIGTIGANGIENLDADALISKLFDIVNRILYGKIGVTKLTTPFYTDEIIYGVAELLGEVSPANVEFLQNTTLGGVVLPELLTKVANKFSAKSTIFDTTMDRNDPSVYGGAGPGFDPKYGDIS